MMDFSSVKRIVIKVFKVIFNRFVFSRLFRLPITQAILI